MILYDRRRFFYFTQIYDQHVLVKAFFSRRSSEKLFASSERKWRMRGGRKEAITILCVSNPRLQSHRQYKINIMSDDDVIHGESVKFLLSLFNDFKMTLKKFFRPTLSPLVSKSSRWWFKFRAKCNEFLNSNKSSTPLTVWDVNDHFNSNLSKSITNIVIVRRKFLKLHASTYCSSTFCLLTLTFHPLNLFTSNFQPLGPPFSALSDRLTLLSACPRNRHRGKSLGERR